MLFQQLPLPDKQKIIKLLIANGDIHRLRHNTEVVKNTQGQLRVLLPRKLTLDTSNSCESE
jgi:hypothetical protein